MISHFLFAVVYYVIQRPCHMLPPLLPNLAKALLRMCRNQKSEVATELEDRGDDVVRMIKAFHDQARHVQCANNVGSIFWG